MDKTPIYPGAIPLDTNWLQPQRNTEIALGYLMQAAFGVSTLIDGLAVGPTSPASLAVSVGAGSIITMTTVDTLTSGFGSLSVDNTDPLVKIGINSTATTMSALTAPVTAGQSQNWLLEAKFLEADSLPIALPYYNPSNPAVPWTGPGNNLAAQNTLRSNRVQLQWVGGTAAATGTQSTPTPDAGWVGVAIVTVITNQTTITSSSIAAYSASPYVPTKLSAQRYRLTANLNLYVAATGGSDTANSGTSASSPFLTMQKAWNIIVNSLDLNGFNVTVNVANGTYTNALTASGSVVGLGSGNAVSFVGNVATPSNCVIQVSNQHAITAINGASISVSGFKLIASGTFAGSPSSGLLASQGFISEIGSMEFGTCAGQHIWATQSGQVTFNSGANYTISGGAQSHLQANIGALVNMSGLTVTVTGTPAFSVAFASAEAIGLVQVISTTYSGSATGLHYSATTNGVINTNGGGASYFPGGTTGATSTGGQYV